MTHARCAGQVQRSSGNVCQPPQRIHEAITQRGRSHGNTGDEGVATRFVGATSNNAHKLILFSQTNGVAGGARIKGNSVAPA